MLVTKNLIAENAILSWRRMLIATSLPPLALVSGPVCRSAAWSGLRHGFTEQEAASTERLLNYLDDASCFVVVTVAHRAELEQEGAFSSIRSKCKRKYPNGLEPEKMIDFLLKRDQSIWQFVDICM